jgi:outer membrane protein OmpA-like peptidoglycan-associated protein
MRRRAVLAALPAGLAAACSSLSREELAATPAHVVFFQDDSAEPPPAAMQVVADAAGVARAAPAAPVRVLGYAAPAAADATPIAGLSRQRAERVAAELERFGIPRSRITVQGRGATAFEAAPVESRRVEIHIGQN